MHRLAIAIHRGKKDTDCLARSDLPYTYTYTYTYTYNVHIRMHVGTGGLEAVDGKLSRNHGAVMVVQTKIHRIAIDIHCGKRHGLP